MIRRMATNTIGGIATSPLAHGDLSALAGSQLRFGQPDAAPMKDQDKIVQSGRYFLTHHGASSASCSGDFEPNHSVAGLAPWCVKKEPA